MISKNDLKLHVFRKSTCSPYIVYERINQIVEPSLCSLRDNLLLHNFSSMIDTVGEWLFGLQQKDYLERYHISYSGKLCAMCSSGGTGQKVKKTTEAKTSPFVVIHHKL